MRQKILLGFFGTLFVCMIPLYVIVAIALWPYLNAIGAMLMVTCAVGLFCVCAMMISFTVQKVGIWRYRVVHEKQFAGVLVAGELVVFRSANGDFVDLSAEHWKARALAGPVVSSSREEETIDEETVVELWQRGISLVHIAQAVRATQYEIQNILKRRGIE